jgi:hypothetical protein
MNAVDEIRHLYNNTTKTTIQRDLTRAVALLKTLETEEERERVAVYMDGLSQMRSEWGVRPAAEGGKGPAKAGKPGKK